MRNLLCIAVLSLVLCSCNNSNYDSNPDINNQTNCPVAIGDTTCSCTGDFSWYMNGVLYSVITVAAHDDTDPNNIAIFGEDTAGKEIKIQITGYTGPGTYNFSSENLDFLWYTDEDLNAHATNLPCTGGKVIVTADAGGKIEGTFYALAKGVVTGQQVAIKGGRFISPWQN